VRFATLGSRVGRLDEPQEEWVWAIGTRLELGVGLGAHEEGVTGQFDELN
jgi:hypothetical protein